MNRKISLNLEVSLIEIIISVLIFAIAGVIILNCFISARYTQIKANDKTIAGFKVQSILEQIKAFDNVDECENYLATFDENVYDETLNQFTYSEYYDSNWDKNYDDNKTFKLSVQVSNIINDSGSIKEIHITVTRIKPYPLLNSKDIYEIDTKKFFPKIIIEAMV